MSRVNISYNVETNGAREKIELPFVIGIISKLTNKPSVDFINIPTGDFNYLFKALQPSLELIVAEKNVHLHFSDMLDFEPKGLIKQIDFAANLAEERSLLSDLMYKIQYNTKLANLLTELTGELTEQPCIDLCIKSGFIKGPEEKNRIKSIMLFSAKFNKTKSPYFNCIDIIDSTDKAIAQILDQIIKNPQFQELELAWRSLHNLFNSVEHENISFRVLNASARDIASDLQPGYAQSNLFQLVYENEYGTIGGRPFSCILFDHYFTKKPEDIRLLSELALLCEKAHAVLLSSVKPELFDIQSFSSIYSINLNQIFADSEYMEWNELRTKEAMRYINLCVPKVLVRAPYKVQDGFIYDEHIASPADLTFGNAAYCMAFCILRAFNKYKWTAAIRGSAGGLVDNIPYYFHRVDHQPQIVCPVDVHITDRKEKELSDLGFIPLCHKKMTNHAIFFSAQSLQKPKKYDDPVATGNAALASRLPYMLNASRFAHYLKIMVRDRIGSFQSAKQLENDLQNWLGQYVLLADNVGDEALKAEYPLREAKISAEEIGPGDYNVKIHVRPHFQLETVEISLGFVVKIGD